MAKAKCPCCGKPFDGKKCRECLYEAFEETEKHDHSHGTYGVPAAQTWKTAVPTELREERPAVFSTSRQQTSRRSSTVKKRLLPILLIPVICIVISLLFELVVGVFVISGGLDILFSEEVAVEDLPEETFTLYQQDGITLFTSWQPNTPIDGDITMYVENSSGQDVAVYSSLAAVDGIMADDILFYCDAADGSIAAGTLWLDVDGLGVKTIGELVLHVEIYESDSYENLATGILITMYSGEEPVVSSPGTEGTLLVDRDGFRLVYQGWQVNEYGEVEFSFYGQNNTAHALYASSSEILADGEAMELYLWREFLPHTQSWFSVTTGDFSMLETDDPSDIQTLSFLLDVYDYYVWDDFYFDQEVEFNCNP